MDTEEMNRMKELQKFQSEESQTANATTSSDDADSRSIYIGNVDYSATPEDIQSLFQACGTINRVTILCDKFTGHPKGFAYVEFSEAEAVSHAVSLNDTPLKGRFIKVSAKRTNVPGLSPRGRGRGRGFYPHPYSYPPRYRGRPRTRRAQFSPYGATGYM